MNATILNLVRRTTIGGAPKDLSIAIGEDWELNFSMIDVNGAAVDITGMTFKSEIRTAAGVLVAEITGAVTSATGGTFKFSLAKAVTELLTASDALCWDAFTILAGKYDLFLHGNAQVKATKTSV